VLLIASQRTQAAADLLREADALAPNSLSLLLTVIIWRPT
jgi:hypothetical protein